MRAFWTLVKRELTAHFYSWTGYVVLAVVVFLLGVGFGSLLEAINQDDFDVPITELFYNTYYFWIILLLSTPLLTMRSFAAEKATGTLEALMTTPVSDLQVVLAKFFGAMTVYVLSWLPFLACVAVVQHLARGQVVVQPGHLISIYLGILLLGGFYIALGCFASSLTRSQVAAAVSTLAVGLAIFMAAAVVMEHSLEDGWQGRLMGHISMVIHMRDFSQGIVDSRPVVFYLTGTGVLLYLTLKSIESRRWR